MMEDVGSGFALLWLWITDNVNLEHRLVWLCQEVVHQLVRLQQKLRMFQISVGYSWWKSVFKRTELSHPYIRKQVRCCNEILEWNPHWDNHPAYHQAAPPPERYPLHCLTPQVALWAPNPSRALIHQRVRCRSETFNVLDKPAARWSAPSSEAPAFGAGKLMSSLLSKIKACQLFVFLLAPPPRLQMKPCEDGAKLQKCRVLTIYTTPVKYHGD